MYLSSTKPLYLFVYGFLIEARVRGGQTHYHFFYQYSTKRCLPVVSRVCQTVEHHYDAEDLGVSQPQFERWLDIEPTFQFRIALQLGLGHIKQPESHFTTTL